MCHTCCSQQHPKDPGERQLGCTVYKACKACTCPALRRKERTPSQRQRHQLFHGWGIVQVCTMNPEQQPILHAADTGMTGQLLCHTLLLQRGVKLPVIGETDFRLTHRLPGKLADGTSSLPFGKVLTWWGYYDLKITATSWGADKYVERSVMGVG